MEYRSELELPHHFVEQARNVGRFECSSVFGAGVAEMEAPRIWSAAPTHVRAELVQQESGAGLRPSARITWREPVAINGKRDERRRVTSEVSAGIFSLLIWVGLIIGVLSPCHVINPSPPPPPARKK